MSEQSIATVAAKPAITFEAARNVTVIAAIYLYFAGFVYRDFFAHELGVPPPTDIPVYTYIVYAYNALESKFWLLVLGAGVVFTYDIVAHARATGTRRYANLMLQAEPVLFGAIAFLLFPAIFSFARDAAAANARDLRLGDPRIAAPIAVTFRSGSKRLYDGAFLKANGANGQRVYLVSTSAESLYVLYQPRESPFRPKPGYSYLAAAHVITIPKSDVASVTTILANDQTPIRYQP